MLEKDNLQNADGNTDSTKENQESNPPEDIIQNLEKEPDNLVASEPKGAVSNSKENDELKDDSKSEIKANNSSKLVKEIENNPENIIKELTNESDNLMEEASNDAIKDKDKTDETMVMDQSVSEEPETALNTEDSSTPTIITELADKIDDLVEENPKEVSEAKNTEEVGEIVEDENANTAPSESTPNAIVRDIAKQEPKEDTSEEGKPKTNEQDQSHVNEIEESNAEDAEDSDNEERHVIETKDYSKLSMNELNDEFERLLKNQKVQTIKKQVEEIKTEFKSQFDALLEEKKEGFINEGGNEIDFYYSSAEKKRYNEIFKSYRSDLNAYYKDLETNLKGNLNKRQEIIEEIKGLINVEENINTTYKHFKELQEQWRNAGSIPRDKYNNTWNNYHHHVEIFYDFLHLNRDLRDMDFKHNLEQKQKIIVRAEELAADDNINRAFRELQVLHKMWKEDLGPVAKKHRDEIWNRFSAATKQIHDKRQAFYADMDKAYEANLKQKEKIIAEIEQIATEEVSSHQAWQNKIKKIEALRQDFFNAGKVPKKANEPTWAKFKTVVRNFNKKKNNFYKSLKQSQYDNLEKKLELIKIAEENMVKDDFETVTPLMKKIQSDWKNIGHVPRKDSDKIWKKFKNACNQYFDKLHAKRKEDNKELYDAFENKVKALDAVKDLKLDGKTPAENKKKIQQYIDDWKKLGDVPQNKRYIDGKFNKAINDLYDKLKLDKQDIEMIKYENKLEHLSKPDGNNLLDNEQNFIKKKIDELKGEINQLENNMQFFSNVDESNPLVKDVITNLNKQKSSLQLWEDKLIKLRKMY